MLYENIEFNKEQIYHALHILQNLCVLVDKDCKHCPLGTDIGDCLLHRSDPDNYKITDKESTWRALE